MWSEVFICHKLTYDVEKQGNLNDDGETLFYKQSINESIKCHHNDIANYLIYHDYQL